MLSTILWPGCDSGSYFEHELCSAVKFGTETDVELILNYAQGSINYTKAMYIAIELEKVSIVKMLTKKEFYIRCKFNNKCLLSKAIDNNNFNILTYLLDYGLYSYDAICHTIRTFNNDALKVLIKHRHFNTHPSFLSICIEYDNIIAAKLLIENGADINISSSWITPLIEAVRKNRVDFVDMLINYGANINLIRGKTTALEIAVEKSLIDIILRLLNNGCDFSEYSLPNNRALEVALLSPDKSQIVDHLLCHGANINYKYKKGKTVLMHAAEKGDIASINKILDIGCDINSQAINGWTALMYACKHKHKKIVKLLLKRGAYADFINTRGENCWDLTSYPAILKYKKLNPGYSF